MYKRNGQLHPRVFFKALWRIGLLLGLAATTFFAREWVDDHLIGKAFHLDAWQLAVFLDIFGFLFIICAFTLVIYYSFTILEDIAYTKQLVADARKLNTDVPDCFYCEKDI